MYVDNVSPYCYNSFNLIKLSVILNWFETDLMLTIAVHRSEIPSLINQSVQSVQKKNSLSRLIQQPNKMNRQTLHFL